MYDYINGKFTYKTSNSKGSYATVETGGIGYSLEIMPRDFQNLPEENSNLKIYTVLLHKEDKMSLCGFLRREERDMFNVLTSVSGVGSKMALTLLNSFSINSLVNFVLDNDYKAITQAKGVGPKLAQKIILELKDKLNSYKEASVTNISVEKGIGKFNNQNIEDAKLVLISLGYENKEIKNALENALNNIPATSNAEEILKKSLQFLSI